MFGAFRLCVVSAFAGFCRTGFAQNLPKMEEYFLCSHLGFDWRAFELATLVDIYPFLWENLLGRLQTSWCLFGPCFVASSNLSWGFLAFSAVILTPRLWGILSYRLIAVWIRGFCCCTKLHSLPCSPRPKFLSQNLRLTNNDHLN